MKIQSYGITDVGKKRSTNQDAIYTDDHLGLYVVADGMGGHSGGDIASKMAIESIANTIKEFSSLKEDECHDALEEAVKKANDDIFQYAKKNEEMKGMGTTVVLLLFKNNNLFIANVGDSRCYLYKAGGIYQVTRDNSLIQEKINMGIYGRLEAAEDKMKNVLVRAVGHEGDVKVDLYHFQFSPDDLFLLCSDGLHGMMTDEEIAQVIEKGEKQQLSLQGITEELIRLGNERGGKDNISAVLVKHIF